MVVFQIFVRSNKDKKYEVIMYKNNININVINLLRQKNESYNNFWKSSYWAKNIIINYR